MNLFMMNFKTTYRESALLKALASMPTVLSIRGKKNLLSQVCLSIVVLLRHPSPITDRQTGRILVFLFPYNQAALDLVLGPLFRTGSDIQSCSKQRFRSAHSPPSQPHFKEKLKFSKHLHNAGTRMVRKLHSPSVK